MPRRISRAGRSLATFCIGWSDQTDREIQRGVMAGFSVKRLTLSGYVFNPDEDKPRFVFSSRVRLRHPVRRVGP
jgi:hypothetical protein